MENGNALKKQFYLDGLCCANCAAKIENKVNEVDEVENANLDFVSKKLTVKIYKKEDCGLAKEKILGIVNNIENNVKVIDLDEENNAEEGGEEELDKKDIVLFGVGIVFFIAAYALKTNFIISMILYLISYVLIGGKVLLSSIKNISKGQIFDENFLMSIATIGAFAIKQFPEAVSVMIFYQIGEFFQDSAVEKSRKSIKSLMDIKPEFANIKMGTEITKVNPKDVKIGDTIVVRPGERIPLDGVVIEGTSNLDTSAVTGESMPRKVLEGNEVFSGSINKEGLLLIKVNKEFKESTVYKILDLVENASAKKAQTERFITKFARYYTPIVVGIAAIIAILPPLLIKDALFSSYLYRALIFLVASCPCAIIISVPLSFFAGIGSASKNGILVKGGNYLEILNKVDTVVFDKTGTLTEGKFSVNSVKGYNDFKESEVIRFASLAESFSNHPIASSICSAYSGSIDKELIKDYKELPGFGVTAKVEDRSIYVGNMNFMRNNNIDISKFKEEDGIGTLVHVAVDGIYAGYILISDKIKSGSIKAVKKLKSIGIKSVMLTGDNKETAERVGEQIGIDEVYSELLPQDKVAKLENMCGKDRSSKVVFVGDGINDAPSLARADIGVSMGSMGSDAAVEASDVVIMNDDPYKIYSSIKIAKKTHVIVWENIIFAFGIKFLVLLLGALGYSNMWEAVFADVGVALIAVLNSLRILKS